MSGTSPQVSVQLTSQQRGVHVVAAADTPRDDLHGGAHVVGYVAREQRRLAGRSAAIHCSHLVALQNHCEQNRDTAGSDVAGREFWARMKKKLHMNDLSLMQSHQKKNRYTFFVTTSELNL